MKKIILSVSTLAFVGVLILGATTAFFSDTEVSEGNVFTAGSVSLTLDGYDHQYLVGGENADDPNENYFVSPAPEGSPASFALNDLKPLDNGVISGTLTNGANDTYVCARITGVEEESPFRDMLSFRTGTGPGGSFGEVVDALPLDTWFTPVAPYLQPMPALPMDANTPAPLAIQYCFGQFIQDGGCELVPGLDYNLAQNQVLTVDIEFYAVQQRSNSEFTCEGMNEPFTYSHDADVDNELEGNNNPEPVKVVSSPGQGWNIGDTMTVEHAFPGEKLTLDITNGEGNYEFVVSMPYVVTGDASMSIFFDTDNNGLADFQYEYNNSNNPNDFYYKTRNNGGYDVGSAPTGYSATELGEKTFTFIIPKSEFESTFRVAVNGTQNGNPETDSHLQMGIPVADIFDGGQWTSSGTYLVITP